MHSLQLYDQTLLDLYTTRNGKVDELMEVCRVRNVLFAQERSTVKKKQLESKFVLASFMTSTCCK